ncbi:hypothetical protein QAD02_013875 [Eretmocerus hayati]|uniref:Uncharacterized protein n=1 Tax=Eretmocerus hayati TaxID=131215 RepID=A0ACC2P4P3_9HYME|nr:hypothetical protein QAD02_013875 [Eretmocerus hayati]
MDKDQLLGIRAAQFASDEKRLVQELHELRLRQKDILQELANIRVEEQRIYEKRLAHYNWRDSIVNESIHESTLVHTTPFREVPSREHRGIIRVKRVEPPLILESLTSKKWPVINLSKKFKTTTNQYDDIARDAQNGNESKEQTQIKSLSYMLE